MRNFSANSFLFVLTLMCFGFHASAQGSLNSDESRALAIAVVKLKMESEGYTLFSDDTFTLTQDNSKYKSMTIRSGRTYVFINVPTEDGFQDSDIYLREMDETLIAKDADDSSVSLVKYYCSISREIKAWVKNYKSTRSSYPYDTRLLVFYK
ncbi:MAG: hypothetical protein IAE84_16785 [Saprospiraceae bacterium]|nr:hypothetical protein [Saprospiraceae bacterium]